MPGSPMPLVPQIACPWPIAGVQLLVLHHMPARRKLLKRFTALLKPGGSLILTELCSHARAGLRDTCGDLWLGFDQLGP